MGLAQVRPVIAANETGSASNVPFVYHDQMLTKAKSIEFCSDAEVMTWNPFCPYICKDFSAFFSLMQKTTTKYGQITALFPLYWELGKCTKDFFFHF